MMNNSSESDCFSDESARVYVAYAAVNMFLGLFVCMVAVTLLAILFLLKKHIFYYQRLFMYLNISVILSSVVSIVSFDPFLNYGDIPDKSTYCTILGYLYTSTSVSQYIIIWWISYALFKLGLFRAPRSPQNDITWKEVTVLLMVFFLPPVLLWIPALPSFNQYGPNGPLCDIQTYDFVSCENILSGRLLLSFVKVLPLVISLVVLFVLFIINLCRIQLKLYHHDRSNRNSNSVQSLQELVKTKQRTVQLQACPLVYIALSLIPTLYYTIDTNVAEHLLINYVLYFLDILIINFRGITVLVVLTFDNDTLQRLKKTVLFSKSLKREEIESKPRSYNPTHLHMSYGDSLDAKELKAIHRPAA